MQMSYKIDVREAVALVEGIGHRAQNPSPILKRWGGYFKSQALKRADAAEGWPPLAESTRKKLEQARTSKVTSAGAVRKSYATALQGYLIKQKRKGDASAEGDLAELHRLQAGGRVGREPGKPADWQGTRAIDRLRKLVARAEAQRSKGKRATVGGKGRKITRHKLLGSVARAIVWKPQGDRVTVTARAPFSAVHNEGGTAGNGAQEPKRVFLIIDDRDDVVLSEIVTDQLLHGGKR